MDELNQFMTPDEEVAMILSSKNHEGPSTSKKAKLSLTDQPSTSRVEVDHNNFQYRPSETRSIGHSRQIWDDSSSDASSPEVETKVFKNVDDYLASIPKFDEKEHRRIPSYMKLLGDYVHQIQTDLPRSKNYSDEEMEVVKKNFILSQLDFLVRENVRRTTKEARKETRRGSLIKPVPTVAPK